MKREDAAIYETLRKVGTGVWSLTPAQREAVRRWPAEIVEFKSSHAATGTIKSTHLSTIKNALATLLRASKSQDLPTVLSLVMDAIGDLRSLEPAGSTEAKIPSKAESLRSIERTQLRSLARLPGMEEKLNKILVLKTPSPARQEKQIAKKIRTVMRSLDEEVSPDHEDPNTAATRHHIAAEIERARRG